MCTLRKFNSMLHSTSLRQLRKVWLKAWLVAGEADEPVGRRWVSSSWLWGTPAFHHLAGHLRVSLVKLFSGTCCLRGSQSAVAACSTGFWLPEAAHSPEFSAAHYRYLCFCAIIVAWEWHVHIHSTANIWSDPKHHAPILSVRQNVAEKSFCSFPSDYRQTLNNRCFWLFVKLAWQLKHLADICCGIAESHP